MNLIKLSLGHGPSSWPQARLGQQPQTRDEQLRAAYTQWLKDHPEEKRSLEELLRDAYNADVTARAAEIQAAKEAEEARWAAAGEAEWDPEVLKRIQAYAEDIQTHLKAGDQESAARKLALLTPLLQGEIEKHNQLLYSETFTTMLQGIATIVQMGIGVAGAQAFAQIAAAARRIATTMTRLHPLQALQPNGHCSS